MTSGAARRRSRQAALQVLYALDLTERPASEKRSTLDDVFDGVAANFELPESAREFALELVRGVAQHRLAIDSLLTEHATNWRLSRMAAVDRNILRMGTFELAYTDTPSQVVLDESIELARRYGSDSSPAFVNGVLDAVRRAISSTPLPVDRDSGGARG